MTTQTYFTEALARSMMLSRLSQSGITGTRRDMFMQAHDCYLAGQVKTGYALLDIAYTNQTAQTLLKDISAQIEGETK